MEALRSPTTLTSQHINYLVWRYLQETGYCKSALRLQAEWNRGNPDSLKFSSNVEFHALVHLVQKGLQFVALEEQLKNGANPAKTPIQLFFGTEELWEASKSSAPEPPRRTSSPRKHLRDSTAGSALDSTSQAPLAKRQRRTTALDGASAAAAKSGDEMDLDEHAVSEDAENANDSRADSSLPNGKLDHHDLAPGLSPSEALLTAAPLAPSPSPPPKPTTLSIGSSVPTQTDTLTDFGSEVTQLLETGSKRGLLTAWNPQQPNVLVGGGDGVCKLFRWPVHFGDAPATNGSTPASPAPQTIDLYDSMQGMQGAVITALAWSPDGAQLAVARHNEDSDATSTITLFDNEGTIVTQVMQEETLALGLAYSASGSFLLAYGGSNEHHADESRDYSVCVWDATDAAGAGEPLAVLVAERQEISGATWVDERSIVACGPGFISQTTLVDGQLQAWQPILPGLARGPADAPYEWSMVTSDPYSGKCALVEGTQDMVAILSQDRQSLTMQNAHTKFITGLQFQPLPQHGSTGEGPRLMASASIDGTVKVWDVSSRIKLVKVLHCNPIKPESFPVLALQFSPDGASLAAASYSRVLFWRPDKAGVRPSESWELKADMGWTAPVSTTPEVSTNGDAAVVINGLTNGVNSHANGHGANGASVNEAVQADQMDVDGTETQGTQVDPWECDGAMNSTLLWSALGKKIAFGSRNQIAVADFAKAQVL